METTTHLPLVLNGEPTEIALQSSTKLGPTESGPTLLGPTLLVVLATRAISPDMKGVAVAVNGYVVPRSEWAVTVLQPHDAVEVVTARQGG
jgi:sulfur carrier protein